MTHGWAGQRTAAVTGRVAQLLDAGYGVLTWDSRGFGASGGEVQLNSPDYEVKDVQVLVSWLAANVPEAQLDAPGDPRVGMSGGSYAGGIQLLSVAFDERIDVIAPEITWNDLAQALGPNGVPKLYWTSLLLGAGAEASCVNARNSEPQGALAAGLASSGAGCQTSDLARYYAMVHATGTIPDEVRDALAYRSPATYMDRIDVPTLLIQGFPDTLFDVDQAVANFEGIRANGAPAKLWLYDGGHSHPEAAALVPNTQGGRIGAEVVRWFDRYLKQDASVDTGAPVEAFVDGEWESSTEWPPATATAVSTRVGGFPALLQGPAAPDHTSAARVKLADAGLVIAGHVTFDVTGVGASEGRLFFALEKVGPAGATRLGAQVQPVLFPLSPSEDTTVQVDLVDVAADLAAGEEVWLVATTWDRDFTGSRVPATLNVHDVEVVLKTA